MEQPGIVAARALFFLNAVIWLAFGVYTLTGMMGRYPDRALTAAIVGILMFGNAGAMLLSGAGLGKRSRWFYHMALAVLTVNIVLTFTDQVGAFDLITLAIDVVLLGLLIATRKRYVATPPQSPRPPVRR